MQWYVSRNGETVGPVDDKQVADWIRTGGLRDGIIRDDQGGQWMHLRSSPFGGLLPKVDDSPVMRMLVPVGRSGLAIAAGYAGLFALVIVPAPLALLLGILAVRDLQKNPEKHGMGRAIFALVVGTLGTVLLVAMLVQRL